MTPPAYKKKGVSQLKKLLILRGLPVGGTKTQMLARLVNEDHATATETKATAAWVRAASTAANTQDEDQRPSNEPRAGTAAEANELGKYTVQRAGEGLRSWRGTRHDGHHGTCAGMRAGVEKGRNEGRGSHQVPTKLSEEAQESFIESLVIGGLSTTRRSNSETEEGNKLPRIEVKMTPAAKKSAHKTWITTERTDNVEPWLNSDGGVCGQDSGIIMSTRVVIGWCLFLIVLILALIAVIAVFELVTAIVAGVRFGAKRLQNARNIGEVLKKELTEKIEVVEEAVWGIREPKG